MPPRCADVSLTIDAPIETVWAVMLDLSRYGEWNPFVVRVEGISSLPRPGQSMLLHVRWSDGSMVTSREEISRVDSPHGEPKRATLGYVFRGPLDRFALVRGARLQTLEARGDGATVYRSVEEFHGLLAFAVPLARVQDGFERHARALKERAESLHRAGSSASTVR